ncbi:MAG: type IA DNA topoisomerase [Aigarchaeota archaeon]|nr:type IA DNA topoisomerase [Candidatus Calditenuis fumarioli]
MRGAVVVAEKPSVARAIEEALDSIGVEDVLVTSVRGHLLDLDLPLAFRNWKGRDPVEVLDLSLADLRYVVRDRESHRHLLKVFRERAPLVIATDNDHEGELIGAEVLMVYRSVRGDRSRYYRMRFNSIERDELIRAWRNLEPDLNWGWVHKAEFRRAFDLLTGAAFTRFLTLSAERRGFDGLLSWGSCQTPTLYFVVERDLKIENFKPIPFWYLEALLETDSGERFYARTERFWERSEAESAFRRASSAETGSVREFVEEHEAIRRPLPARTDDALRDLVAITGRTARELMEVLERLYAEGYISYPRTDTNRYPEGFSYARSLRAAVNAGIVGTEVLRRSPDPRQGRLDDGAHPPIYPIRPYSGRGLLAAVWEYIARRFVANAYFDDALVARQSAAIDIGGVTFGAHGQLLLRRGFLEVYPYQRVESDPIPKLSRGQLLRVVKLELREGKTSPPPRMSESELLATMEAHGIGTDATRATFPALIVSRGYAVKTGKSIKSTELGRALVEALRSVDERLVTPETRRKVEERMGMVERGLADWRELLRESLKEYRDLLLECVGRWENLSGKLAELISAPSSNRIEGSGSSGGRRRRGSLRPS